MVTSDSGILGIMMFPGNSYIDLTQFQAPTSTLHSIRESNYDSLYIDDTDSFTMDDIRSVLKRWFILKISESQPSAQTHGTDVAEIGVGTVHTQ